MKTAHMTFLVLPLFLALVSTKAHAQDMDYTLQSDTVTILGDEIGLLSTLAKNGGSITWTQHQNGEQSVTVFNISATAQNWSAASSTGDITYTLDIKGHPSTLTLIGDSNGLSATLVLDPGSQQEETYAFGITSISYN